MEDLPQLHQLFPKTSTIELKFDGNLKNEKYLSKFEELKELNFISYNFMINNYLAPFTELLKSLNTKKLRKIEFPTFVISEEDEVLDFYKILFEKTNLVEFQRVNSHCTIEESKIIASWIQNNSTLQTISLARKNFLNNSIKSV
jgi:hypothetical protein